MTMKIEFFFLIVNKPLAFNEIWFF